MRDAGNGSMKKPNGGGLQQGASTVKGKLSMFQGRFSSFGQFRDGSS